MNDIVERLRGLDEGIDGNTDRVVLEAADEIERLHAIFRTPDPDWTDLHLHRSEDGTITAVPMAAAGSAHSEVACIITDCEGWPLWVDASGETP